ncbi:hypothetical protein BDV12DRAFT_202952 [Aspergillus spectabilis]
MFITFLLFLLLCPNGLVSATPDCGTEQPSDAFREIHRQAEADEEGETEIQPIGDILIDTFVHIVQRQDAQENITQPVIDQIAVLNARYAASNTGIGFNVVTMQTVVNDRWSNIAPGSPEEVEMKIALRQGTYRDLNIYVVSIAGRTLGFAYNLPVLYSNPNAATFARDGVVIRPSTLPGGTPPFDEGTTAVHEVGHWLGLLHTFQPDPMRSPNSGCEGRGDYVADTPAEDTAAFGCQIGRDSCPTRPGRDPVNNYMDYSDDFCLTKFTHGQTRRMRMLFGALRDCIGPSC